MLFKKRIIFELLAPYLQEQNRVLERMSKTIMDITPATILERYLNYKLWPKLIFAIIYIKDVRLIKALNK